MKLLLLINSLILAGAEVLVRDLAPQFRSLGIEVEVAVLRSLDNSLEAGIRTDGIPLFRTAEAPMYSVRHVLPLARTLSRYDLVHVHLFPVQLWAAIAKRMLRSRTPLVVTEHNPNNRRRRGPWRWLDRATYAAYEAIACNSEATAEALRQWLPETERKITVIPNGVDLRKFSDAAPATRDVVADNGDPILISIARLEPQKDHATLLRALAQVPNANLVLVGDGVLRLRLEGLAAELGISNRVRFMGRRSDVPNLLRSADVFVHVTHSEGFGIAAVEAMAAGVPVIATEVPGLAQVVGDAGVLVPTQNPDRLAAAIRDVLGNRAHREALAASGRERAQQFSIRKCAERYLAWYEKVLQSAG